MSRVARVRRRAKAGSRRGVVLRSAGARVEARIEPRAGCAVVSMVVGGREQVRLPEPLGAFLRHVRTGGIPLLFPWANRLRSDRYDVLSRRVDLRGARGVHRDSAGRPMHGLLLRWADWTLDEGDGGGGTSPSTLTAEIDWRRHAPLHRAFPFDFVLRLRWRLFDGGPAVRSGAGIAGIEIETEIESFDAPVPLAFGWHPYLALPAPRAKCLLFMPPLSRVTLDAGVPRRVGRTSGTGPWGAGALDLGPPEVVGPSLARLALDDLFAGVSDGAVIAVESPASGRTPTRRIALEFVRGYHFAQLYSPRGADYLCVEPMTAPTAALSDEAPELPLLGPRRRSSALFRIVASEG